MNTYISNRLKKALRLGAISFLLPLFSSLITSCEDVPMPFNNPELPPEPEIVVIDPVGNGTKDNPYNVAGVLAYLNTLGADVESTKDIWVKGVVTSVTEPFNTQYGNASFNISDTEDAPNKFTFYRGYYFGNKKYNNENDLNVAINDVVLICGKVINYRGNTPETSQNKAYVVSINGKGADIQPEAGGDPKGTGTQADPFNIAAAVAKCKEVGETASTDKYYIKGIADGDYTVGSYKNIDVDLVDKAGSSEKFKVYHCKGLDGKDITEGFKVSKGDEIVVYGPVVNFKSNTPETATGAYVVSVNGKAPDGTGGGGDTPGKAVGSIDNPKTCSEALTVINGLADGGKTDVDYYVKGKITKIKTSDENIAKYKNIDYIITDGTTEITVYRGKNLNNTDFTEAGQINVGDEVVVLGKLFKYVKDGNMTPEIDQGNYIVKLTKAGGGESAPSTGSIDNPKTCSEALTVINGLTDGGKTDVDYYVKGKITKIKTSDANIAKYKNIDYIITDGTTEITVYRGKNLNNTDFTEAGQINVGDEVVVLGKLFKYVKDGNMTPEIDQGNYIVKLTKASGN